MRKMTITEALAEVKTIGKRVEKQRDFVGKFLTRPEQLKDPLAKEGGSESLIANALDSIRDLEQTVIRIRLAVADANAKNTIKIGNVEKSIAEWLVWRRDVAPRHEQFLATLSTNIDRQRQFAQTKGGTVVAANSAEVKPTDIVVNIKESELHKEIEEFQGTLGALDGQLSLKNATITIQF